MEITIMIGHFVSSFPKFLRLRRVYIPVASIILGMLVLGGVFVLPSLLHKSPIFPVLCSGNFQSAKTSANSATVPTLATSTSPDGESIGLSEGATIFDLQRPNPNVPEVQYKLQAPRAATKNDSQNVVSSLKNAMSRDQTDAEAQIYLENWQVLRSNHPHITLVVGVNFASTAVGASRGALQGAYTVQKECNKQNQQDNSKMQVVLMIANVGGDVPDDLARSAKVVANQIAYQVSLDPTIVGIMGWLRSSDSINVNHQLRINGSLLSMVSPISASDELQDMSNFFRVSSRNSEQAKVAANFMLKKLQRKKVAIIYDQTTSFGNDLKNDLVKVIPNNIVGLPGPFIGGDSNTLQHALTNVLDKNPDTIFFAGYVTDLDKLLNGISFSSHPNLLIIGGDTLANTNAYTSLPPGQDHVYFTAFASPNEWDGADPKPPFFRDYQHDFGTLTAPNGLPSIDPNVMLSYDGMLTLLYASEQVLSRQSTITSPDLEGALKQITVTNPIQGITGRIAFDTNGDQDQSKMIFVEHIEGISLKVDEKQGCLQKDNCSS